MNFTNFAERAGDFAAWARYTVFLPRLSDGISRSPKSRPDRERMRQIIFSAPHYLRELRRIGTVRELYSWIYFKFPNFFPLEPFPPYLSVEVTNQCNFSCTHCSRTAKPRPIGCMDVGLFEKIVREASQYKSVHREFKLLGSGEVALHPQFRGLMQIAARYKVPTVVYTNGTLLRSFSPEEILTWGMDTIVVSVDGVDAASHERFKKGSDYASLRRAVSDLHDYRLTHRRETPLIEARHVILPGESTAQLLQFRRSWIGVVDTVKFQYLEPATGLWDFENPSRPRCRGIRREMGVWWDGTMPLCPGYWRDHLGNARDSTISELWRHPKIEYMRECHRRRDYATVPVCLKCRKCA